MDRSEADRGDSVGIGAKSGFGVAELGLSAAELLLQVYLLEYYLQAGLKPALAGSALAIAVGWDAVSDPLMGSVSDRTRSRTSRGSRLSYMAAGAFLASWSLVALFSADSGAGEWALFYHLLGWYVLLNTALTLIGVPHLALANDIGRREEDRVAFFGWRMVFSGFGLIIALAIPTVLESSTEGGVLETRQDTAWYIAGLLLVGTLLTIGMLWAAAGRVGPERKQRQTLGARSILMRIQRSGWFRLTLGAFVFIAIGRAFNASLALIFYKSVLSLDDAAVAQVLLVLSLSIMVSIPGWTWLAKRFPKARLCLWGSATLFGLTASIYLFMTPNSLILPYIVAIFGGMASGSVVLLESMFSDIVESEETDSEANLAGAFYGLWRMATKIARAIGVGLSGFFLGIIGYQEGQLEQVASVDRAIRIAFGPGVALFFGLGVSFVWLLVRKSQETISPWNNLSEKAE